MKKPFSTQLGGKEVVVACAVLLAGCTGQIGSDSPGSGGSGNPPANGSGGSVGNGSGGSNQPGSGGSSTNGSGGSGSGSTSGSGGNTGSGGSKDPNIIIANPPAFSPVPGTLRRLTRTQFRNALKDVFGYVVDPLLLDSDSWEGNFASIGAAIVVTSDQGAEQYNTAVEAAVNTVFADATKRATFIGCTPTGQATDTCVRGYLQKLGLRAWRRPLTTAELDTLVGLAASASTTLGSPVEGARWATVALFEAPSFLYRPELGPTTGTGARRFTGYEMTGRLSFLIWNSLPDPMLMDQAQGGMLDTTDGIRTAVNRMLDLPAGRESVGNFAEEYLRLDRIATQAKDPALYPDYNASLQSAMLRDMRDTWTSLVFDDQTSVLNVFTTTKVVVNSDLAKLYGLSTSGLTPTTFKTMSLPADGPRAGILSKAALLSNFANQQFGSPTLRGKFIREALMCGTIQPPPGNVNTAVVDVPTDVPTTKRQRLEQHRTDAGCKGCHAMMDPLGLPLETYDALGKYRTTENGLQIDPSGTFDGVDVADSHALGVAASQSVTVAQCLARRYFDYAMGYKDRPEDGTVLNALAKAFNASGYKMRDLILAVVTNDAFSTVAPQP